MPTIADRGNAGTHRLRAADLVLLGINGVIGSGIFLLPGAVAAQLGPASLLCTLAAGGLSLIIGCCFAMASARHERSGGPYQYALQAFGQGTGFVVGFVAAGSHLFAWAARAHGFCIALSYFVPTVGEIGSLTQRSVLLVLIGSLSWLNVRGVELGARLSTVITVAKLGCMAVFVALGAWHFQSANLRPFAPQGWASFGQSTLLMMYAYVGFEYLAVPAGEIADPRRTVPRAVMASLAIAVLVYAAIHLVTLGTLASIATSQNAVAAAARSFLGAAGGALIALAILLSTFGVNSVSALVSPRTLSSMGSEGQLPQRLAVLHARYCTPWLAIVVAGSISVVIAWLSSFAQLAIFSVAGRLIQYLVTCVALLVFLRRESTAQTLLRQLRSWLLPLLGMLCCLWLLAQISWQQALAGAALLALALLAALGQRRWRAQRSEISVSGP